MIKMVYHALITLALFLAAVMFVQAGGWWGLVHTIKQWPLILR